jgi:MFS family permease
MRLSIADAICYALMVGLGEAFLVADAVRLGAGHFDLALLVSLPLCLGAAGPILALGILARLGRRRPIVASAAAGQATMLAVLALTDATDRLTPRVLIALSVAYQMFGQAAGAVWSSWYGDLVPSAIRGRYFSRRSRAAHVATCGAMILAGLALHALEPASAGAVAAGAGGTGYAVVFAAAAVCRAISCGLLTASPEPSFAGLPGVHQTLSHLRGANASGLRRLIGVAVVMQLAVYAGSPYFAPFMLEQLHLSYLEYTAASVTVVAAKAAMVPAWGHAVDRYGARAAYALAAMLVAVVPLPWLFAGGLGLVIVAQSLSGFAWGGHEVSHFSLVLEKSSTALRPSLFATLNALNGGAQLLGALLGGWLLGSTGGDFRYVFGASMGGRIAVAATIPLLIHHVGARAPIGRRQLLLRIVGFRSNGGVEVRPLPVEAEREDSA